MPDHCLELKLYTVFSMINSKWAKLALAAAVVSGATLGAVVTPAQAALTIDLRHEWVDVERAHKDRVMISDRFANGLGYSVETKAKSGGDSKDTAYSEMESNGSEFSLTYQYKLNPKFIIQPGMTIEFGDGKAIYKPNLRFQYNFDNGMYAAFRYRYEYTRDNDGVTTDEHVNRYEGWLGYKINGWGFEANYIWRDSNKIRFDNKETDYEYDFKVSYAITPHWEPFVQVGNVKYTSTSDQRQTRYRIGIKYKY